MSELHRTRADARPEINMDINGQNDLAPRHPPLASSPLGVYERPAKGQAKRNNWLLWLLLVIMIFVLLFLVYQWWL